MRRFIERLLLASLLSFGATTYAAGWQYEESTDKMDKSLWRFALLESNEAVKMSFPYKTHKPLLQLRTKDGKELNVLVIFSGQMNRTSVNGGNLRIKFDDGKPLNWPFSMPADAGKTGLVFLDNEKSFLDRIRKSKTLAIELDYFSRGKEVVTFAVDGLDIKRLGLAK